MIDIVRDFLLEPVILIGVIVFIGLVLQRKGFEVVVKGTLKAMIGFMIMQTGCLPQRQWDIRGWCISGQTRISRR